MYQIERTDQTILSSNQTWQLKISYLEINFLDFPSYEPPLSSKNFEAVASDYQRLSGWWHCFQLYSNQCSIIPAICHHYIRPVYHHLPVFPFIFHCWPINMYLNIPYIASMQYSILHQCLSCAYTCIYIYIYIGIYICMYIYIYIVRFIPLTPSGILPIHSPLGFPWIHLEVS